MLSFVVLDAAEYACWRVRWWTRVSACGLLCGITATSKVCMARQERLEARQDQSNRRFAFGDLRGRLPGTWTERTAWKSLVSLWRAPRTAPHLDRRWGRDGQHQSQQRCRDPAADT